MDVVDADDSHVLVVTRNGYGKRTQIEEYRLQGRYGQGIRTLSRNEKTGPVVSMHCINAKDDLLIITSGNVILRTSLDQIREIGRNTGGVKVMDLADGDSIVGVAVLDASAESAGGLSVDGLPVDGASVDGAAAEA
jgi:DNA gyrase subunit A